MGHGMRQKLKKVYWRGFFSPSSLQNTEGVIRKDEKEKEIIEEESMGKKIRRW